MDEKLYKIIDKNKLLGMIGTGKITTTVLKNSLYILDTYDQVLEILSSIFSSSLNVHY
jgi:hypothetical protein